MSDTAQPVTPTFGWLAFGVGAVALVAAFFIFWAGPFAPQQSGSVTLGEVAADITKSAARAVVGAEQPAPEPVVRTTDDYLKIGVAMLGALAVIFALVGFIRREPIRAAVAGGALGSGAIMFQLFTGFVLLLIGALILMALIYSLGESFSSIFGG